jgi:hypothetical protein
MKVVNRITGSAGPENVFCGCLLHTCNNIRVIGISCLFLVSSSIFYADRMKNNTAYLGMNVIATGTWK